MANFAKQMKAFAEKTKRRQSEVVELSLRELFRTVTFRTPIGDPTLWASAAPADYVPGTLINSWNTSLGPGSPIVRSPDSFAKDTFTQIDQIVKFSSGRVTYFQNPTPYARRIEYGWSSQAPQGMVRLSVRNFRTIVKRAIRQAP